VEVDDVVRARAAAAGLAGATVGDDGPASGPGPLTIALDGVDPADLNAALVGAGVRVAALAPQRDTLEEVFLHLVEGADVPR
jgi:ABC-2 type transport system ATP-binding protein